MEATVSTVGDAVVLTLTGVLGFSDNKNWRTLATEMLEADAKTHILDITKLEDLDSAGLGMMLAMQQWAKNKNRTLKVKFDEASSVGNTIKLAKFDSMFDIY
jgi:anti-anti-sigma factor